MARKSKDIKIIKEEISLFPPLKKKCQWPVGNPGKKCFSLFRACGKMVKEGRPYCSKHQGWLDDDKLFQPKAEGTLPAL